MDEATVRSMFNETTHAINRLKRVLNRAMLGMDRGKRSSTASSTASKPSPPNAPLDPELTGLDAVPIPSTESPIGRLLYAMGRKCPLDIWNSFIETRMSFVTNKIKATEFSALLHSIQPSDELGLRQRNRLDRHGRSYIFSENQARQELKTKLAVVIRELYRAGHFLSVRDYHHIIDCARAAMDPKMAEEFWNNTMSRQSNRLDTWIFNSFMAAVSGGTASVEREFIVNERTLVHRVKRGPEDMQWKADRYYRRMLEKGVAPNSMTYDVFILAMGRMGDLISIGKVLKEVWGIDMDSLRDGNAIAEETNPPLPGDSPLYPSVHTLLSIATAFCQNGKVDVAVRTVDHMSRLYKVTISKPTWVTILNWAYVYSRKRDHTGIPASGVETLWNIMISEPYNIRPTIEMYDSIISSYLWRQIPYKAEEMMERAWATEHKRILRKAKEIELRIKHGRTIRKMPETVLDDSVMTDCSREDNKLDEIQIHKYLQQVASLARDESRAKAVLQRWSQLLVVGRGLELTEFAPREVPRIVEKWGCFLSRRIVYILSGGYAVLDLRRVQQPPDEPWRFIKIRKKHWKPLPLGTGSKEEDDFF